MSGDLVAGEVRAYRTWFHDDQYLKLVSLTGLHWESATIAASCHLAAHQAPTEDCSCGLYAYYRPSTAREGDVFGVVAVEGRVLLATRGLRAERMRILALATDDDSLGRQYGVPVYPSRQSLIADYPPQGFSELVDVDPTDPPDMPPVVRAHLRHDALAPSAEERAEVERLIASVRDKADHLRAEAGRELRVLGWLLLLLVSVLLFVLISVVW